MRELDIEEGDFEIASLAWEAYRAPTPELCSGLLDRPLGKLSFLKPAMEDLLAELPSPTTGLGATEARLLELIASGHNRTDELFRPGALKTRVFDPWELGALLEGTRFRPDARHCRFGWQAGDARSGQWTRSQRGLSPEPAVANRIGPSGP